MLTGSPACASPLGRLPQDADANAAAGSLQVQETLLCLQARQQPWPAVSGSGCLYCMEGPHIGIHLFSMSHQPFLAAVWLASA